MSGRTIAGIVLFFVALGGGFLANTLLMLMIQAINRVRAEGDRMSYIGFALPKIQRIFREYRYSYPSGTLHMYAIGAWGLTVLGMIGFAVCFRIIG